MKVKILMGVENKLSKHVYIKLTYIFALYVEIKCNCWVVFLKIQTLTLTMYNNLGKKNNQLRLTQHI